MVIRCLSGSGGNLEVMISIRRYSRHEEAHHMMTPPSPPLTVLVCRRPRLSIHCVDDKTRGTKSHAPKFHKSPPFSCLLWSVVGRRRNNKRAEVQEVT
ncbi:hypothetical protein E2C01_054599 [Portunus trituberculatus]|uniref:Uncharacterized protein n=1 Tax=Portunus trituberculatus TaxID=210409 RepID=A0A5B7GK17_PORTR|nr:hypothetical protein [Portunus trituberculatus]